MRDPDTVVRDVCDGVLDSRVAASQLDLSGQPGEWFVRLADRLHRSQTMCATLADENTVLRGLTRTAAYARRCWRLSVVVFAISTTTQVAVACRLFGLI